MKSPRGYLVLTNNPLVQSRLSKTFAVDFRPDASYLDILTAARDMVYIGHTLYTHPLSGSVKPNETPYKSIVLSDSVRAFDPEAANIMSESMETFRKFPDKHRSYTEALLTDFQLIDFTLLCGALDLDAAGMVQ